MAAGTGRRGAEPGSVETGKLGAVELQVLCPQGPCRGRELGQRDRLPRGSPGTSQRDQNHPSFCSLGGKDSCGSHLKILLLTKRQRNETIGQESSRWGALVLPELGTNCVSVEGGGSPASSGPREVMPPLGHTLSASPGRPTCTCSLSPWPQPDAPLRSSLDTWRTMMMINTLRQDAKTQQALRTYSSASSPRTAAYSR